MKPDATNLFPAALATLVAMALLPNTALAHPRPIEYVNVGDGRFVLASEAPAADEGVKVVVRGQGERADRWITGVAQSTVAVFDVESPSALAIVCPGGGYFGLSFDKEGTYVARWLNKRGIAAGVLKYPVSRGEPLGEAPLRSANDALKMLTERYPGKPIGIIGFSAGGHLAASAGTPIRLEDQPAPKLDFQVLVYPVLSLDPKISHGGSGKNLIGSSPSEAEVKRFSTDLHVSEETPPTLLIHTVDDRSVPFANCTRYLEACAKHKVPVELHIYPSGGHGYGMWKDDGTIATWPAAMEAWLDSLGFVAGE
ncbi:MAG: alpha/beta hydrolase [Planctomycetota bacterium]